jgi:excisionase family DNA binding protein
MFAVKPSLAQERANPRDAGTDNSRVATGLLFLLTLAIAGLSVGHCRTVFNAPPPIRHLALATFLLSGAFQTWAMIVNPFFSPVVRIQTERGHQVIAKGPYRLVRHPGYLAMLISVPSSALAIGSLSLRYSKEFASKTDFSGTACRGTPTTRVAFRGDQLFGGNAKGGLMSDLQHKSITNVDYPTFDFEPLLDSEEAAALLKIHPKTLQKLARNGEIDAIQIGKLWRFRASALNRWLEKIAG